MPVSMSFRTDLPPGVLKHMLLGLMSWMRIPCVVRVAMKWASCLRHETRLWKAKSSLLNLTSLKTSIPAKGIVDETVLLLW